MKKNYFELLKDPRWQKKRLEILNRDHFTCQECGETEVTLNVHHLNYDWNKLPWQYSDEELKTLCEECHNSLHEDYNSLKQSAAILNGDVLHYAVDIIFKMQHLYPDDCRDILDFATELSEKNKK